MKKNITASTLPAFKRIALLGKVNHSATENTLAELEQLLLQRGYHVVLEERTAEQLANSSCPTYPLAELGEVADLAVVVGGDGNMLGAARILSEQNLPVIGVNRGNLGFLTDLDPDQVESQLLDVLAGQYRLERRFLLQAEIYRGGHHENAGRAINEIVLHSDKVAHMIEFEVYVDDQFVYSQRSDGLIISTPTGSTAYALSAGGSILTPGIEAISIIPMFPHTLSSRPLTIPSSSKVLLRAAPSNEPLQLSCDGHLRMHVEPGDEVIIKRFSHELVLVHPLDYCYYRVLRNKLGWGSRLF